MGQTSGLKPHPQAVTFLRDHFMPESFGADYLQALEEEHPNTASFVVHGLLATVVYTLANMGLAFSLHLTAAEVPLLALIYFYPSNNPAWIIAALANLVALALRDGYRYPMRSSVIHKGIDALTMASFVAVVERVGLRPWPSLQLPLPFLLENLALSVLAVTALRVVLFRPPVPDNPYLPPSYKKVRLLSWVGGICFVIYLSWLPRPEGVPPIPGHNGIALLLFFIAYYREKNALDGSLGGGMITAMQKPEDYRRGLEHGIYDPGKAKPGQIHWGLVLEVLMFIGFSMPAFLAPFYSKSLLTVSFARYLVFVVSMPVIWIGFRRMHVALAAELRKPAVIPPITPPPASDDGGALGAIG